MKLLKEIITDKKKLIVFFISLLSFIFFMFEIFHNEIITLDIVGYNVVSKYFICDFATPIIKFITNFGGAVFLTLVAIALFLTIRSRKITLPIILNLILASNLNFLLKNIVQRSRPTGYRLIDESGYSFPSGHSMTSMAFYGFLIYLIYKYIKNKKIKYTLIAILSVLIISIGFSRIYLGVHYTSDVIAGFLLAIAYLIIYIQLLKNIYWKNSKM